MNANTTYAIEYDRAKTVSLGEFCLSDKTRARYRSASHLAFSTRLYQLEKGQRFEHNALSIQVAPKDNVSVDTVKIGGDLRYELIVNSQQNLQDLKFDISLDMSQVEPVFELTEFLLEIQIEEASKAQSEIKSLSFHIDQNKEHAFLVVKSVSSLNEKSDVIFQGTDSFMQTHLDETNSVPLIEIAQPIKHLHQGRSVLLDLELFNSATHAAGNAEEPANTIVISKLEASRLMPQSMGLVQTQIVDQHDSPVHLDRHLLTLRPEQGNRITVSIVISQEADKACFNGVEYTVWLDIAYQFLCDSEFEDTEPTHISLPISFRTLPDLSGEVLAFDFGTSANSAFHHSRGRTQLINLNKIYSDSIESKFNELSRKTNIALEKLQDIDTPQAIKIEGGSSNKKFVRKSISALMRQGLAKSSEVEPFISNVFYRVTDPLNKDAQPFYELESYTDDSYFTFESIRLLKSEIGHCQIDYQFQSKNGDGVTTDSLIEDAESKDSDKVANLLRENYRLLNKDYFLPARNSEPIDRLVITHPNSYVSGQIEFLKEHIAKELDVAEVQTLSESDAVIYDYLKNVNAYRDRDCDESVLENILCYDMGAGTLDLSFRQVTFDAEDGILIPALNDSSKLLNMLSVQGAGNELDGLLAQLVERKLRVIEREIRKFRDGDIVTFSLLEVNPNANSVQLKTQKALIDRVSSDIKKVKVNYAEDPEMAMKFEISTEVEGAIFFEIRGDFIQHLKQSNFCQEHGLALSTDKIEIEIGYQEIEEIFLENYAEKHIDQPIEVISKQADNQSINIDTLIVSGRGALFPNVKNRIAEKTKALFPGVNIISYFDDPVKMKTMVAEGALAWGKDAGKGHVLFSTPFMHGTVGIATCDRRGDWQWQSMLNGHQIQAGQRLKKSQLSQPIYPRKLSKLLVLQCSATSPEVTEKLLSSEFASETDLLSGVANSDYFKLLEYFDNPMSQFDNAKEIQISIRPLQPEDPQELYGEVDEFGYLNIRIEVTVHTPGIGQWTPVPKDVVAANNIKAKRYWPYNVIEHIEKALIKLR